MRARQVIPFIIAGAMVLSACGSSASSGSTTAASQPAAAESTDSLSAVTKDDVVGIYVGENGSVLTFFDDGKASYYYTDWDKPETDLPWSLDGNTITWKSTILGCKVTAEVPDADTSALEFKSNSLNWDDEKYYKTTGVAKELSADECKELIRQYSGAMNGEAPADAPSDSTQEITVGSITMDIPSYYTENSNENGRASYLNSELDGAYLAVAQLDLTKGTAPSQIEELVKSEGVGAVWSITNGDTSRTVSIRNDDGFQGMAAFGTGVTKDDSKDYVRVGGAILANKAKNLFPCVVIQMPGDSDGEDYTAALEDILASIRQTGDAPASSASSEASTEKQEASDDTGSSDAGLDPKFKEAMDSYVAFFEEYAEFMRTYTSSSSTSADLLTEYADYMQKYSDAMQKLDAIDEDDLTPEEKAYYIDTMAKIQKILVGVAGQ